jgi:hypothetical protein
MRVVVPEHLFHPELLLLGLLAQQLTEARLIADSDEAALLALLEAPGEHSAAAEVHVQPLLAAVGEDR